MNDQTHSAEHANSPKTVRSKWIVANWKMHGALDENQALFNAIQKGMQVEDIAHHAELGFTLNKGNTRAAVQIAICPPFPYLAQAQASLQGSGVNWGVQDVSRHTHGAYTGEIAASMLAEFGARYVLVGHSERRQYHRETDEDIAQKTLRALEAGLIPIICVGESQAARDVGHTEQVVGTQLQAILKVLSVTQMRHIVVAYEPIWAIGTSRSATPEEAQAVHAYLRAQLTAQWETENAGSLCPVPVLYGGSMKAANAAALLAQPDIDGGLIGGASLNAVEFLAICKAALLISA
jgi:triosephosphate isomerase